MKQKKERNHNNATKHVLLTQNLIQVLKNSNGYEVEQARAEKEKTEAKEHVGQKLVRRRVGRSSFIEYYVDAVD